MSPSYPQSTPADAVVQVSMPALAGLDADGRAEWTRYLAAHPRWDVRTERGCRFAVRLEPQTGPDGDVVYEGTLNGFYSDFQSTSVTQTRVLTGLGCTHGFGADRGHITRADALDGPVQLVLEDYMDQPGTQSYLIVTGGEGVTVEVFEQSHLDARTFTESALQSVHAELQGVLDGTATLSTDATRTGPPVMTVSDGMQPGIYAIDAWVNPGMEGETSVRVVYVGPDGSHTPPAEVQGRVGQALSADTVRSRSARLTGFSSESQQLFRYDSEVTVYEGDWGEPYRARFELWFTAADGSERKLLETERVIEGWMR